MVRPAGPGPAGTFVHHGSDERTVAAIGQELDLKVGQLVVLEDQRRRRCSLAVRLSRDPLEVSVVVSEQFDVNGRGVELS